VKRLPSLDRRLVLEARVQLSDGAGGFTENWKALGALWAEVNLRAGGQRAAEEFPLSRVTYRIVVRATPVDAPSRPVPGQRFRDGARCFHIRAVAETEPRGRYLTCFAEEEVAI